MNLLRTVFQNDQTILGDHKNVEYCLSYLPFNTILKGFLLYAWHGDTYL